MAKHGVLLINLGSPEAPRSPEVKNYLKEFLTDPYVIDVPWLLRQLLVRIVIAPRRSHSTAQAYRQIWSDEGSPLVNFTRAFADKLKSTCSDRDVRWAMRYGQPSIRAACSEWDITELDVVPLYPQYAESSTRTAVEKVRQELSRLGWKGRARYLRYFFAEPEFIDSEARRIQSALREFRPDHLLLSFHGLPQHHLTKIHPAHCQVRPDCCDHVKAVNETCYRAQCFATARALQARLEWPQASMSVSFQSRLGRRPWIQPYTDHMITDLAARGFKRVLVSCPSFVADCLETLEEVGMRLREQFLELGGENLQLVPALNDEDLWVTSFAAMIKRPGLAWDPL
ncbi:MAG: ferrochelatase [Bdellovibrionales bacterium]